MRTNLPLLRAVERRPSFTAALLLGACLVIGGATTLGCGSEPADEDSEESSGGRAGGGAGGGSDGSEGVGGSGGSGGIEGLGGDGGVVGHEGVARVTVGIHPSEICFNCYRLTPGEPRLLEAKVLDAQGQVMAREVEWTSSDDTIISFDSDGRAQGIKGGSATISATADGVTGGVKLDVF